MYRLARILIKTPLEELSGKFKLDFLGSVNPEDFAEKKKELESQASRESVSQRFQDTISDSLPIFRSSIPIGISCSVGRDDSATRFVPFMEGNKGVRKMGRLFHAFIMIYILWPLLPTTK